MIKLDNDILSKFPRPRDGLILVYLMAKARDGEGETTYQQIADDTDYTKMQVRISVLNLINKHALSTQITRRGFVYHICKSVSYIENSNVNNTQITRTQHSKTPIYVKEKDFYNKLIPFLKIYPKEMIRAFYDYWSEPNKSGTRMRFEGEKTWDLKRRLARWANNNKQYNGRNIISTNNNQEQALQSGATALENVLGRIKARRGTE